MGQFLSLVRWWRFHILDVILQRLHLYGLYQKNYGQLVQGDQQCFWCHLSLCCATKSWTELFWLTLEWQNVVQEYSTPELKYHSLPNVLEEHLIWMQGSMTWWVGPVVPMQSWNLGLASCWCSSSRNRNFEGRIIDSERKNWSLWPLNIVSTCFHHTRKFLLSNLDEIGWGKETGRRLVVLAEFSMEVAEEVSMV